MITTAIEYATEKHASQTRRSNGEPYVRHCIRVSNTVCQYRLDVNLAVAAILHDTLEDTSATFEELVTLFGSPIATMVLHLTNDEEEMSKVGGKRAYLAGKINQLTPDELLIKLADRLDNISDLGQDEKSQLYREQTQYVFLECLSREGLSPAHLLMLEQIHVKISQ